MGKPISLAYSLIIAFLVLLPVASAITKVELVSTNYDQYIGWGASTAVTARIKCNNPMLQCTCNVDGRDYGIPTGSTGSVPLGEVTAPTCGTGVLSNTYSMRCRDFADYFYSTAVTVSASSNVNYPSQSQFSTYNSANSAITSASSKINSASAAISDALSEINNANSFGSQCVNIGDAASYVSTAQSKKTSAAATFSSANSNYQSCEYDSALSLAQSADSQASEAIASANQGKQVANEAVNEYNSKMSQADSQISRAASAVESASTAIADAQDIIDKAKSTSSCIKVADNQQRIDNAKQSLTQAETSKSTAQTARAGCDFSTISSYSSQSANDAESARQAALAAKDSIVKMVEEYNREKNGAEVETNSAQALINNARAAIDKTESRIKETEKIPCVGDVGVGSASSLKLEAEGLLNSANEQFSLAKTNYGNCDFVSAQNNAKSAQGSAENSKAKATESYALLDKINEQIQQVKSLVGDQMNNIKNKIDTAEGVDSTIGTLLETHAETTLGKKAFSEAKAKREQGREKLRAAKTDYEKASLDFASGDCSKANSTLAASFGYADDAEKTIREAHAWITQKIQESGDCANRINNANNEMNKLYFKSESGRIFIIDSLEKMINISKRNIELPNVRKLKDDIRLEALDAQIKLYQSKLRLDEGGFVECLSLAEGVRNAAVSVRKKVEEVAYQIKNDVEAQSKGLIEYYQEQNIATKDAIDFKSKIAITDKEYIQTAKEQAKKNDIAFEEIKTASQTLPTLQQPDDIYNRAQLITDKAESIDKTTTIIVQDTLPKINRIFYSGVLAGAVLILLVVLGVYGVRKFKARKGLESHKKEGRKEEKPSENKLKKFGSKIRNGFSSAMIWLKSKATSQRKVTEEKEKEKSKDAVEASAPKKSIKTVSHKKVPKPKGKSDRKKLMIYLIGICLLIILAIGIIVVFRVFQMKSAPQMVCNPPYMYYGTSCCLDKNKNNICDNDEVLPSPPQTIPPPSVEELPPPAINLTPPPTVTPPQTETAHPPSIESSKRVLRNNSDNSSAEINLSKKQAVSNRSRSFNNVNDIFKLEEGKYTGYGYQLVFGQDAPYTLVRRGNRTIIFFQGLHGDAIKGLYDGLFIEDGSPEILLYCMSSMNCRGFDEYYEKVIPHSDLKYPSEPLHALIKKYQNQPITDIKDGTIISDYMTYEVTLANGMQIMFDTRHNFPMQAKNADGSVIFIVERVYFNTIPQTPIDKYTPKSFQPQGVYFPKQVWT